MLIIKNINELNKQAEALFLNYNKSFYAIIKKNDELLLAQVFLNNDNYFQWFFIGKPYIMKKYYKSVKSACADIITNNNAIIIITDNKKYLDLIKILYILDNKQLIDEIFIKS